MEHHNSCINTKAALDYLADHDPALIAPLLTEMQAHLPGEKDPGRFLSDPNNWVSSSVLSAMYKEIKALVGRDDVVFDIGYQSVARKRLGYIQRVLLFAFRDHRRTLKRVQQINDRFNRNKTVEVVKTHERGAVVRLKWFQDLPLTRDFCLMNQGVYTAVPVVWNDPPLELQEHKCFFQGDDYCEYHLHWDPTPTMRRILLKFFAPWKLINAALAELKQDKEILKEKYAEVQQLNLNLKSQLDKLVSFQQAGTALLSTLNFQELIHLILSRLVQVSVLDRAALCLLDQEKKAFRIVHGVGVSAAELGAIKEYTVPVDKFTNIVARVAQTGEPEFVENLSQSAINRNNLLIRQFKPDAFIALPLKVHGKVVGVLIGDKKNSGGKAIANEKDFLITFSNQIAIAIHNADLYRKLTHSERQYRRLVENAHDGIWIIDENGIITFANQRFSEILGQARVLGHNLTNLVPASQKTLLIKSLAQNMRGQVAQKELQMINTYGKPVTVIMSSVPIMEDGRYKGSFAMVTDITERKKIESHLLHRQKMESIGTMAGGIAHDFNNILTGILGHASLLRFQLKEEDDLRRHVEIIESSSMRAAELVQQIVAFSRGTEPSTLKPADLNHLIHETVGLLESSLGKEYELQLDLSSLLTQVNGNPTQIQQALINLCLNARDAMPNGGKITVTTDTLDLRNPQGTAYQTLEITPGKYIRLRVTDRGTGISKTHLNKIFDPFFTTKEVGKGSGLGLAMVYGIVKNARGYVHVESKVGVGTTFDLLLRPAESTEKEIVRINRDLELGGHETLLLVDDESLVLDLGHEILSSYGYQVLVAADGLEALEIFRAQNQKIQLVILDLIMPNLDGFATYKKIMALNPKMKFVICSAYGADNSDLDHLPRISKPFMPDNMVQTIREVLDAA